MSAAAAPPGPSKRMVKLLEVLEKVLVTSVDKFSFADMHGCFPGLAKTHGNLLSEYCTDLLDGIRQNVLSEFRTIAQENQLDEQLLKLEQLNAERPKSLTTGQRRVARLPKSPNTLLRNHAVRQKRTAIAALKAELAQVEGRNAAMREASDAKLGGLKRQARELQDMLQRVEKLAAAAAAEP